MIFRLLDRFILVIVIACIGLFGCLKEEPSVNFNKSEFTLKAGIMLYKGVPFTGTLIKKGQNIYHSLYKNGKKHGLETIYYQSGNLNAKRYFKDGNCYSKQVGWWDNSKLRYTYRCNKYGIDGLKLEYFDNGVKRSERYFKDGKEHGKQKFWFSDGKPRTTYIIKNGRRYGIVGTKLCRPSIYKAKPK